jgi:hypothetical protein
MRGGWTAKEVDEAACGHRLGEKRFHLPLQGRVTFDTLPSGPGPIVLGAGPCLVVEGLNSFPDIGRHRTHVALLLRRRLHLFETRLVMTW